MGWLEFSRVCGGVRAGARYVMDLKVIAQVASSKGLREWVLSNLVGGSGWFCSAVGTYMGRGGGNYNPSVFGLQSTGSLGIRL